MKFSPWASDANVLKDCEKYGQSTNETNISQNQAYAASESGDFGYG